MVTKRLKKNVHRSMKRRLMGCKKSKKGLPNCNIKKEVEVKKEVVKKKVVKKEVKAE